MAIAIEGSGTISEMRCSGVSGNAWVISGRAGATVAPLMRIIIPGRRRNSNIQRVG